MISPRVNKINESEEKENEIQTLKNEMQRRVAELLTELEGVKKTNEKLENEQNEIQKKYECSEKEKREINKRNEENEEKVQHLSSEKEVIEKSIEEMYKLQKENNEKFEIERNTWKNERIEFEQKINKLEEMITNYEKAEGSDERNEIKEQQMQEEIIKLKMIQEKLQNEKVELQDHLERLVIDRNEEQERKRKEIEELKKRTEDLEKENAKVKESLGSNGIVNSLKQELEKKEKENQLIKDSNEKLQQYHVFITKEAQRIVQESDEKIKVFIKENDKNGQELLEQKKEIEFLKEGAKKESERKKRMVILYERKLDSMRELLQITQQKLAGFEEIKKHYKIQEEQLRKLEEEKKKEWKGNNEGEERENEQKLIISGIVIALKIANPKYEDTKYTVEKLFSEIQKERIDKYEWAEHIQSIFAKESLKEEN
ncbi:M protein, serotype 5 precursor, putative [Entamoeba dispar SAW760]|uniref:M protein, serotype 5, putative n=1 Tax=Entamoeba dispar (strain ATCC PRA-260 / SAW760) TaxID=370354 RepID=B0E687_ENTDS|nr:M protein, serotype 5 precursor, putative [Entamoeba dispar SAW760]EDR29972.1 M protein, serotype 5 precursor, putative [Entamoeba dispar SAW760]|eukprot:EDR29972.1 M protein, serotype 5 precursor, putative [Entamoeba dispar SAW760]